MQKSIALFAAGKVILHAVAYFRVAIVVDGQAEGAVDDDEEGSERDEELVPNAETFNGLDIGLQDVVQSVLGFEKVLLVACEVGSCSVECFRQYFLWSRKYSSERWAQWPSSYDGRLRIIPKTSGRRFEPRQPSG